MRTAITSSLIVAFLAGGSAAAGASTPSMTSGSSTTTTAQLVASDAYGRHDATPRGVPYGYSWRTASDAKASVASTSFRNYKAINVWGQVFATSRTTNYSARLVARNPRVYFFDGKKWTRAKATASRMEGAYYTGDFQSGATTGTARKDRTATYSMPLSGLRGKADALHFWWSGMYPRVPIPAGTKGILVRQEMRLSGGTAGANVIGSTGADLFATPRTIVHPQGWNPGIPNPRMKRVTSRWQPFYATTVDKATLFNYPPPAGA